MVPAIAAWLVPGLGHWLLGQRDRALILFLALSLLWGSGLVLGGIAAIDFRDRNNLIITVLQAPLAGNWAVFGYHRSLERRSGGVPLPQRDANDPAPLYEPSHGRMQETAALFAAIAGMLNLLAIVDVLYRDPRDPRNRVRSAVGPSGG